MNDELPRPRLSIMVVENTNMGDHGERLRRAYDWRPGETVDDLVKRVFPRMTQPYYHHDDSDVIEIRVIVGSEPESEQKGPSF
jgi:hypothetical protein